MKSLISDPNHVPQKKSKVIKELPDGKLIPKEIQKMAGKGFKLITDDELHNYIIGLLEIMDRVKGPFIEEKEYDLYLIDAIVLLYDNETKKLWATKDSDLEPITPGYWDKLASR